MNRFYQDVYAGPKAEFPKFKRDLITLAKQHGLFRVFTEDVEIPVADEEKSVEEIQAMGFAEDEIRKHFLAWNILSRAIKGKADNDILRRVTSPTAAWRILVGSYSATTRGAKQQCMKALTNRRVKPGSNPIHTLSEMADDARDLRAKRTDISDEIVCLLISKSCRKSTTSFGRLLSEKRNCSPSMGSWVSFVRDSTSRGRSSQDLPTPLSLPRVRDERKVKELEQSTK